MQALMTKQAIRRQARANSATAAALWDMPLPMPECKGGVQDACLMAGVPYPASKWGVFPEMLRTQAPEWWGRQLKKTDRRAAELLELKAGRITRYCSDLILTARRAHKKAMAEMLADMLAICEQPDGTRIEKELAELVAASPANPAIRRAELMTRIAGFENYAIKHKHVAYFYTFTCPSRFHRNSGDRWAGLTPKDASDYLCKVWAKVRAKLKRMGLEPYGFRVAEPHKDACPHWHCLFWYPSHHEGRRASEVMREYFLADTPNEPGAQMQRVKTVRMDASMGRATGYIAKYIAKNVDGQFDDNGTTYTFDDKRTNPETGELEKTGLRTDDAAARVEAWAACWAIRQFQQIGGPKVGAWRELRRLGDDVQTGEGAEILEPMRAAANVGQWDLFVELDEQHRAAYGERVKVWSENPFTEITDEAWAVMPAEAQKNVLNAWHEPTLRTVKGLAFGRDLKAKTRFLKWTLMLKKAAGALDQQKQERAFVAGFIGKIEQMRAVVVEDLALFAFDFDWFESGGPPARSALESCQ